MSKKVFLKCVSCSSCRPLVRLVHKLSDLRIIKRDHGWPGLWKWETTCCHRESYYAPLFWNDRAPSLHPLPSCFRSKVENKRMLPAMKEFAPRQKNQNPTRRPLPPPYKELRWNKGPTSCFWLRKYAHGGMCGIQQYEPVSRRRFWISHSQFRPRG